MNAKKNQKYRDSGIWVTCALLTYVIILEFNTNSTGMERERLNQRLQNK